MTTRLPSLQRGFSLVEMAIVLLIVGLLMGGLLPGLASQMEQGRVTDTKATMASIMDALYGYAAGHRGALPCPATLATAGYPDPAGAGVTIGAVCTDPFGGFVPGRLLGLAPVNANGFVVDAWGNPIRYAVSTMASGANRAITFEGGIRDLGIANFGGFTATAPAANALLSVCASSAGITAASCGPLTNTTSNDAIGLIYSYGPTGVPTSGADEGENNAAPANQFFVSHTKTDTFDHIVQWIPKNVYLTKMIAAGVVP